MRTLPCCLAVLLLLPSLSAADDAPAKPRTAEEIKKKLADITATPPKEPAGLAGERAAALRRLKAYRYLAGVPYDDLTLDDDANTACQAGAALCAKIGHLDHKPKNPGLPEDEYELGVKGTSRSNLAWGFPTLSKAVDTWMDDSDEGNVGRVGHRRWCLNPLMQKTGFGRSGQFSAMYVFDQTREKVSDYDFVAWPPAGLVPVEYFKGSMAWTVSVNPKKFNKPGDDVKVSVYPIDKGEKSKIALRMKSTVVEKNAFGIPNCIIFRPELPVKLGRGYFVKIEGLTKGKDQAAAPLEYTVEFFSLSPK
jgi:Cysteine-rich secretory protein family